MNKHTLDALNKCVEMNKFFLNGLFAVIYEEIRYKIPIGALSAGTNEDFWIFESVTSIKNILSCKSILDFSHFEVYCKGIHSNILDKRPMEVVPYINKAFAYLDAQNECSPIILRDALNELSSELNIFRDIIELAKEQASLGESQLSFLQDVFNEFSVNVSCLFDAFELSKKKVSSSKKLRQKTFAMAGRFDDDDFIWDNQLKQDNFEQKKILEIFDMLSKDDLSLLYRIADDFYHIKECDIFFMQFFSRLNEKGQQLFREALEVECSNWDVSSGDNMCDFCSVMSKESIIHADITPIMLYDKMTYIGSGSIDDAESLCCFRFAKPDTWEILEMYHRLILNYPDENIEGLPFGEKDNLIILLCWLVDIPSLKKN